jgi:predicted GNAT family acetyltransferase
VNEVVDNPEAARYEIFTDGGIAGFVQYRLKPGKIVFIHTEIRNEFEGRGLASVLIHSALDEARARDLKVVPLCPFVARYIKRHPEYRDLVDEEYTDLVTSSD